MILLSHERQCFSHQQTFGTTPTACIRFAILSRIEILHILLEHFYDSQRNENAGSASPTSSAAASREKSESAQSAPTVPAAGCRHGIGCPPRREGSGRPPGDVAAAIVARSTRGAGRKPYPSCLAGGSSDRTVQLWGNVRVYASVINGGPSATADANLLAGVGIDPPSFLSHAAELRDVGSVAILPKQSRRDLLATSRLPGEVDRGLTPKTAAMMNYPV